ncbi:DUF350 domain-containing protein [Paenibacillus sediminis]|uniref:Uncharacterized membrane protein YjfL (UPF0719 family) n=1 Tax=Paenibacillus sediminis TaxID=664909 RepID=A0ABS4H0H7_9BACL|nr:DUF350 domain-containing protein [Paenibacillus sediminis]MBP1935961.1 uncharacterized membrane protein YjfL (UPF0719 family) [Paenibacillus sediminis]
MSMDIIWAILLWTGSGALLLFILMYVDSLFTKYKDFMEVKQGNIAVTIRLVMKLLAQGYILSVSISTSSHLGEALIVSAVSFVILLILESIVRLLMNSLAGLNLDEGTQKGIAAYGLFAGSLHIVGALIITACL